LAKLSKAEFKAPIGKSGTAVPGGFMQKVEIRVEGILEPAWEEWLDGFNLVHTEQGETILTGEVKDQAALYGLIAKLRDLGLKLVLLRSKD
jgi:hypothetical protein